MNKNLKPAIIAAVQNAERLLDDARWLLDLDRYPSACALSILAQEEFAKSFLLHLIEAGAFPWNDDVWGALRDHKCKQLLGLLMQYVSPEFEEMMEEYKSPNPIRLPRKIADAMNIIRHEKLSNSTWQWLEDGDPPCDPIARKIGDGKRDAQKQRRSWKDGTSDY